MKVAVVIPSLYEVDGDYLELCVESLRQSVDWPIIVVTNGSNIKPELDIEGVTKHLHISTQGQCRAVNVGVQSVPEDSEYVLISNSDMYYAPKWAEHLRFEHPVFSPNLMEPVDNAGSAPPFLKEDGGLTLKEFKKDHIDGKVKQIADTGLVAPENGFNFPFFIRKDVWDEIEGYDEAYDPWGSNGDTDLQTKIAVAGITPMRYLDVIVYHFSNKSGTFDGSHQAEWQQNWDYFTEKWGFNRDSFPADVWSHKNMVDWKNLRYKPTWLNKYVQRNTK